MPPYFRRSKVNWRAGRGSPGIPAGPGGPCVTSSRPWRSRPPKPCRDHSGPERCTKRRSWTSRGTRPGASDPSGPPRAGGATPPAPPGLRPRPRPRPCRPRRHGAQPGHLRCLRSPRSPPTSFALGLLREVGEPLGREMGRGRPPRRPRDRARGAPRRRDQARRRKALGGAVGLRRPMLADAARPSTPGRRPLPELLDEVEALVGALGAPAAMAVGIGLPGLVDHADRGAWPGRRSSRAATFPWPRPAPRASAARPDRQRREPPHPGGAVVRRRPRPFRFAVVTIEHGVGMGLVQGGRLSAARAAWGWSSAT
jgi:hypothetical protein